MATRDATEDSAQAWKDWCALVDHVAAEESTASLPASYTPEAFLPATDNAGLPALTDTLVHELIQREWTQNKKDQPTGPEEGEGEGQAGALAVGGSLCSFEDAAQRWFQPQMTMTESLHAKPLVPHFSSHAMDQLQQQQLPPPPSGRQRKARRTEDGSGSAGDKDEVEENAWPAPLANTVEGPNFLRLLQLSEPGAMSTSSSSVLSAAGTTIAGGASSSSQLKGRKSTGGGRHSALSSLAPSTVSPPLLPPMRAGLSNRLNSGFVNPQFYAAIHRQPNFMPIILVPAVVTAPIQLMNVKRFLEEGVYTDPTTFFIDHETGAASLMQSKPELEVVSAELFKRNLATRVAFTKFRVVDDPAQIEHWEHVCAALVTGQEWEFQTWFPQEHRSLCQPSHLFNRISGYLAYFEENKIPQAVQQWNVQALILTKRVVKAQQHIRLAAQFWETLFNFLDRHPLFNKFTVPLEE